MSAAYSKFQEATTTDELRWEMAKEIRARADDPVAMHSLADELDGDKERREDEMRAKQNEHPLTQSAETGAGHQAAWSGGAKVMAGDTKSEVDAGDTYPGEGERENQHVDPAGGVDNNVHANSAD